jgi:hypothetical protein
MRFEHGAEEGDVVAGPKPARLARCVGTARGECPQAEVRRRTIAAAPRGP